MRRIELYTHAPPRNDPKMNRANASFKLATMNAKDFEATYNHKIPVIYDAGSKKSKPEEQEKAF